MGIFNRKASDRSARSVLWDGTALRGLTREGFLDALVRTDGVRPRLEDNRERGGSATVVLASPALKWAQIETPKEQTAAKREEEALWSLLFGQEDARFSPDGTACQYRTAPGIAGKTPTIAHAVTKISLGLLDDAASAADWRITKVVTFADALRAGCAELAPALPDTRKAWLALGDAKSYLVIGSATDTAYVRPFGWGASEILTDKGIDNILRDVEETYRELTQEISADTPVERISVICPEDSVTLKKWRGVVSGMVGAIKMDVTVFDAPQLEILPRIALLGADSAATEPDAIDFWRLKPANERRTARLLAIGLGVSVAVLAGSSGFLALQKHRLAAALEMEKSAEAQAKALPDPAVELKKMESAAAELASRIDAARRRKETADAAIPRQESSPTGAGDAMTAFAGFSAKGAGLDGFSARWVSESEPPALSAVGTAQSRDGAVDAALSLSRIGYGKWGGSQVGWTGKAWTFRIDEPKDSTAGPAQAVAAVRSGSPSFVSPGEKAGNAASAGIEAASRGERLPRERPGASGLPPQTPPVKKQ